MIIKVKVSSKAKISRVVQEDSHTFKVFVKSPPENGKANQEVIFLLAEHFRVPKNRVLIKFGKHHKNKLIEITDCLDVAL